MKGKPTKPAPAKAAPTKAAPTKAVPTSSPPVKKPIAVKSKWEGEDEDEDAPVVSLSPVQSVILKSEWLYQSDWEESSEEESSEEEVHAPVAPPKKKGTLKAKLAEKEAQKALKKNKDDEDEDEDDSDASYDSDAVLDPREKARLDKERELKADLGNAVDLLGAAALGGAQFFFSFF